MENKGDDGDKTRQKLGTEHPRWSETAGAGEGFDYLGSKITWDSRCDSEIKKQIGIAKTGFDVIRKLVINRKFSIATIKRFIVCYIWSKLLYDFKTWMNIELCYLF